VGFATDITVIGVVGMTGALIVILLALELLRRIGSRGHEVSHVPRLELSPDISEYEPSDEELAAVAATARMVELHEEEV
jgi:hypothetical protein